MWAYREGSARREVDRAGMGLDHVRDRPRRDCSRLLVEQPVAVAQRPGAPCRGVQEGRRLGGVARLLRAISHPRPALSEALSWLPIAGAAAMRKLPHTAAVPGRTGHSHSSHATTNGWLPTDCGHDHQATIEPSGQHPHGERGNPRSACADSNNTVDEVFFFDNLDNRVHFDPGLSVTFLLFSLAGVALLNGVILLLAASRMPTGTQPDKEPQPEAGQPR